MKTAFSKKFIDATNKADSCFAKGWGEKSFVWPVYDFEIETGLLRIDVMGKLEVWHMSDCKEVQVGPEVFINEELYNEE